MMTVDRNNSKKLSLRQVVWIAFLFSFFIAEKHGLCAGSSIPSSLVLRLRLADGSIEKIQILEGKEETMTLEDILRPFEVSDDASIKVGSNTVNSQGQSLKDLGVKHGTMITIASPVNQNDDKAIRTSRFSTTTDPQNSAWSPFPDLAKDYEHALLRTRTRRSSQKRMSYGDIAHLQSSLHSIEPQQEGPLKRVYICRISAERFHAGGITKNKKAKGKKKGPDSDITCRVGLLLGTIQKERVDSRPKKARTSLSSQTSDSEYCTVAKVQALWEPPSQNPSTDGLLYDALKAQKMIQDNPRIIKIAEYLGLVPIGWIFSYRDDRLDEDKGEPQAALGMDLATGATLQIQNMINLGREDGKKFVTLAMDANTGATEAFQLSDVTIQMVHENMFDSFVPPPDTISTRNNPRTVPMKHAVLVDGQETSKLESVLCLVNTAMLSNVGIYAGKNTVSPVKKSNGALTNKSKNALLTALDADDQQLLEELCNFNILVSLDKSLSEADMEKLCGLVRKWARGQKQGTTIDSKLKMTLKNYLGS